jgi:hypothetical protein
MSASNHNEEIRKNEMRDQEKLIEEIKKSYDYSREMGIGLLKVLLGASISLIGIPILLLKDSEIKSLFLNGICLLYWSWLFLVISVVTGFISLVCIFEGYYKRSHCLASIFNNNEITKKSNFSLPVVMKKLGVESELQYSRSEIFFNGSYFLGYITIGAFLLALFSFLILIFINFIL